MKGFPMEYVSAADKAFEWGVSQQTVTAYCRDGRIPGATRKGQSWLIPAEASKPSDGRKSSPGLQPEIAPQQGSGVNGNAAGLSREAEVDAEFGLSVIRGAALLNWARPARNFRRRDAFKILAAYLDAPTEDRVCVIYGLRRTGKTTLLRQAVLSMDSERIASTAYIKATSANTMAQLNRDLQMLLDAGCQTVFIDEVTLVADFIDSSSLLSDVFAAQGMKIVLSGTDSLGFWLAERDELYDRALVVHTTYVPFREHRRVLATVDIDDYIRFGGTMQAGQATFEDSSAEAERASFYDDESTRRYIDTAICRNIQHSLEHFKDGTRFRHLEELYEKGELTGAINRIIEDMNHRFLARVLTRDFKSHDLGVSARNLRSDRDALNRTALLDEVDVDSVTAKLMEYLEICDEREREVGITQTHAYEIREYLQALDLVAECDVETTVPGAEPLRETIIAQPGMRYCQARALVEALLHDPAFNQAAERERNLVCERILQEVSGRMLEEIVLLDTLRAARPGKRVFRLRFAAGEFDMVVYDAQSDTCECYEVKHSTAMETNQARHLCNPENLEATERRFGHITRRCVLYRGPDGELDGIEYRNVEEYLCGLGSEGEC